MKKLLPLFATVLVTISLNSFAADCAKLSGEFTIGTSEDADFTTLGDACDALNCGGIEGPVTFRLESGTYDERVTLAPVRGVSDINTVTFTSVSGLSNDVVITHSSGDATLVLVGTSFITFEHLTFDHQ